MRDRSGASEGSVITPWLVGLAVLLPLLWGIARLIELPDREVAGTAAPQATDPGPGVLAVGSESGTPDAPRLADLRPLGPEDAGQRVRIDGDVVGEPTPEGHWVLTDEDDVVFVRTDRPAAAGQTVTSLGVLRPVPDGQAQRWTADARLREAAGWTVHRELHLDALEQDRRETRPATAAEEPTSSRR